MRTKDRMDRADPKFVKSFSEISLPILRLPNMEKPLPNLATWRKLKELPRCVYSRTETTDEKREHAKTDMVEPSRENERSDKLEPRLVAS